MPINPRENLKKKKPANNRIVHSLRIARNPHFSQQTTTRDPQEIPFLKPKLPRKQGFQTDSCGK